MIGGSLTLTAGASQVDGVFSLNPNTALTANGATVVCTIASAPNANGANFTASGGAVLTVDGLTAYQKPQNQDVLLRATGAGSQLAFPGLTSLAGHPSAG